MVVNVLDEDGELRGGAVGREAVVLHGDVEHILRLRLVVERRARPHRPVRAHAEHVCKCVVGLFCVHVKGLRFDL